MGQNFAGRWHHHFQKSAPHRARHQWPDLPGALVSGPQNGKIKSQMATIQISDPSAHTLYNCFMLDGMNLISKRSDPRIGTQTFTATNLILSEPDPKLFDLPEGFRVVDRRQSLPLEN
jgi:hypothetical protein